MTAKKPKRHYYIIFNGSYVGETWAVSAEKARNNYWWKKVKQEDANSIRTYNPSDFDVIEA